VVHPLDAGIDVAGSFERLADIGLQRRDIFREHAEQGGFARFPHLREGSGHLVPDVRRGILEALDKLSEQFAFGLCAQGRRDERRQRRS